MLYAFEIIMAFEFHNREFPCATKSVIPAGSSYGNIEYQSCAYQSMGQGQLSLQGDDYLAQQFGFSYDNIGRDFGILILFIVGLLAINMWLVENVDWAENSGGGYEYAKKKGEATKQSKSKHDEENASSGETAVSNRSATNSHSSNEKTSSLPKSSAVFTWRDLDYTIQHEGGDKQLLNGVSGYCEPGKLTALVGASGAGKSTCKLSVELDVVFLPNSKCYSDDGSYTASGREAQWANDGEQPASRCFVRAVYWLLPTDGHPRRNQYSTRGI